MQYLDPPPFELNCYCRNGPTYTQISQITIKGLFICLFIFKATLFKKAVTTTILHPS